MLSKIIPLLAAWTALQCAPTNAKDIHLSFELNQFCIESQQACKTGGAERIKLDDRSFELIAFVQHHVSSTVRYRPDKPGHGKTSVAEFSGDCEDFAWRKRRDLIDLGFPPNSLRIVIGKNRDNYPHAVLFIQTTQGDLILDMSGLPRFEKNGFLPEWKTSEIPYLLHKF